MVEILPRESAYNQTLIENVHPPDWQNPTPSGRYNLVVIGAGSAGLVAAAGTAGIGGKVALIEKGLMGGDCLNMGCVPSKAVIRSGQVMAEIGRAAHFGVEVGDTRVDFARVMERMRGVRAHISPHDSAVRYSDMGVDVYFGAGKFTGADTIEVAGQTLHFNKAMIATGSHPFVIPFEGLEETGYLTNETIFNLTEQPRRLAVIGGGPIGSELAQAFQRLGTAVTLIDISDHILPREDADAAELVQQSLLADGVTLLLGVKTERIAAENGAKRIYYAKNGQTNYVEVDEILVAVGRRPNVKGLNLEAVGVEYDEKTGVTVNDYLQTTNPRIYAGGDTAVKYQFTHVAGQTGAIVVQNALFPFPKRKFSDLVIPWVTYTDPEVAHVGMYPHQAKEQGLEVTTFTQSMDKVDRAVAEGELEGFVKIHVKKGTDKILGATVVNRHAGEMLNEITLAMTQGLGLGALSGVIHPYPTQAEAIAKAASEYNKTRLTPFVAKLFNWWLARTR